jgi:glycosyltransferase involved in cell wall biosynthesis
MLIWIFQTGEPIHTDEGDIRPMRAMNLIDKLIEKGHEVVFFSSSFSHQEKKWRVNGSKAITVNENLKILLLDSPGYTKNKSFSRIYDHYILGLNLSKQLNQMSEYPDVAIVGYPPIETAARFINWLNQKNIPVLIDIKDQWPIIFTSRFPLVIRPFVRILFAPYYIIARNAMKNATAIVSLSDQFIEWSRVFSRTQKSELDKVAYLTAPSKIFMRSELEKAKIWWNNQGVVKSKKFRIIFIGSFSEAFDFETILDSAKELANKNVNCEFILCGYGDFFSYMEAEAKKLDNVRVFGFVDQAKIFNLSEMSSMYIAPYKNTDDFMMSVPNKIIDALKLSLPILTPLKGEVKKLILKHNVGILYDDHLSLTSIIENSIKNSEMLESIAINSKNLYKNKFDFDNIYDDLVDHIENFTISKMETNISSVMKRVEKISQIRKNNLLIKNSQN